MQATNPGLSAMGNQLHTPLLQSAVADISWPQFVATLKQPAYLQRMCSLLYAAQVAPAEIF
jgi:hypothetical protein